MKKLITLFTPTYNRAHTLHILYESLKAQTSQNFEWVIVDDGSHDDTEALVTEWIKENKIPIVFEKKINEGKHIAINRGVKLSKSELFFIVDSDDYLTSNATSLIESYYPKIKNRKEMAGVSFRRGTDENNVIGSQSDFNDLELSIFDFRYQKKILGDMAEVYKTEILKQFPFPKFENEKFCAESLVWNRIGLHYKMLWTFPIIYICHYLEEGLTNKSFEIRKKSPHGSTLYYSEFEKMPIPWITKLKANINYWRFAKYLELSCTQKVKRVNPVLSLIGLPLSLVFLIKDNK